METKLIGRTETKRAKENNLHILFSIRIHEINQFFNHCAEPSRFEYAFSETYTHIYAQQAHTHARKGGR